MRVRLCKSSEPSLYQRLCASQNQATSFCWICQC
uniref:Uncharacterized protein n=1 Tax=Arundo donax TaxID=35708 RepID=A0A0A9BY38_ARUDO